MGLQYQQEPVVLTVDDSAPGRYVVARTLQRAGYTVLGAATGSEALRLVAEQPPDLIILDVHLPDLSGFEICERLRLDPATTHLPVLFLSATSTDADSIVSGLNTGGDVYLVEPVEASVLLATVKALLRTARAEKALRKGEAHLNEILSSIQDGFFEVDREWRYTYVNPRAARNGGFEPEQLLGRSIWEAFPYLVGTEFETVYREVMGTRQARQFEVKSVIRDQWYAVSVYPSAAGISGFWTDITARKRLEESLRQTEAELREAQRLARVGSWYWDIEADTVTVSEQTYRMLGLDPALPIPVLREQEWQLYTPESQEQVRAAVQTAIQSGVGYTLDVEARQADGTPLWLTARAEAVRGTDGRIIGLRGTNQDITARKQAEEEREWLHQMVLAAERARTEIAEHLSSEIAHRVKNNLAMISGLLQMQMLGEPDPHTTEALRDAIGRIRTFAVLHEQMYGSRSEEADLLAALQRIGTTTEELFAGRGGVEIQVRGEPLRCHARVATNLCVVTNELITNALRHGGPGADGRRTVVVSLGRAGEGVQLSVWNSGTPVPAGLDPAHSSTLGLRLVHDIVVGQYRGRFRLCPSDGGTLAEVAVPGEAVQADSLPR